jgi:hypothetical protein
MADISLAAALAVSFAIGGGPAPTASAILQGMLAQTLPPLLAPVSPLDEIRACEAGRTALRAGAPGADAPFDATGEGFGSSGGAASSIGTAYESADGWRCEVEQVVRDGRPSLDIRIVPPPAVR